MSSIGKSGTFTLGDRPVRRLGYGAMQLAGPGVFGPPKNHDAAVAVLREAVARGVNHIDTSDFYGPHVTNQRAFGWAMDVQHAAQVDDLDHVDAEIAQVVVHRLSQLFTREGRDP
jgi:diketogulonate reductase-like aldo/keto reductase